jgi:hypothetical protein
MQALSGQARTLIGVAINSQDTAARGRRQGWGAARGCHGEEMRGLAERPSSFCILYFAFLIFSLTSDFRRGETLESDGMQNRK